MSVWSSGRVCSCGGRWHVTARAVCAGAGLGLAFAAGGGWAGSNTQTNSVPPLTPPITDWITEGDPVSPVTGGVEMEQTDVA